jgi:3-dehydroquinate synthase
VVTADERELGVRAILNFGHTLGHAVEGLSSLDAIAHGEGVAIGMVAAAQLSVYMGLCEPSAVDEVERVITAAGLPTRIPATLTTDDLILSMRHDKKATGGTLTFVLMRTIGEVEIVKDVPETLVRRVIEERREL